MRGEALFHAGKAPDLAPAQGDEHEGEGNDEKALEKVCPGAGEQTTDEAVEQENDRHPEDDRIGRDRATGGLADHLACALEHGGHVDGEVDESEGSVDDAHPGSVAVFDHLADRSAAHTAEERRDEPVEGRGKEVLPLKPDAGETACVDSTSQRNRHFCVGADAEALANHEPAIEAAVAQEVALGAPDVAPGDDADSSDDDQVADQDDPVDDVELKTHTVE